MIGRSLGHDDMEIDGGDISRVRDRNVRERHTRILESPAGRVEHGRHLRIERRQEVMTRDREFQGT